MNNKTTRWDLIKILGNTRQFHHWIKGFLLKDRFLVEEKDGNTFYYSLTANGELLLKLLRNGALMSSIVRLSGKRLRRV